MRHYIGYALVKVLQPRNRLEDRRGENDEVSR